MIFCLNGLLGNPKQWESLFSPADAEAICPAIVAPKSAEKSSAFWKWASDFTGWVADHPEAQGSGPHWLVGYSQGGRLAMHALLEAPELWAGVILISADPGFSGGRDSSERTARIESDRAWAKRFGRESIEYVLPEWEKQEVFGGRPRPLCWPTPTLEESHEAATQLRVFSVGLQDNLRKPLKALEKPILWVAGSEDAKYRKIAEDAAADNSDWKSLILEGCGHRAPWDHESNPQAAYAEFLSKVYEFMK